MPQPANTPFDLSRIQSATSLRHIEYHDSLPSTNTTAIELLPELARCSPALVLTRQQSAGRGRAGNTWWSCSGALTCSLVVDASELPLSAERRPLVSIATGLAVRDALTSIAAGVSFSIKWPNDVLADSRKISGILVEQHVADHRAVVVIGMGINVNNSVRDAPADIAHRATSLFDLTGRTSDLSAILIDLLNRLDDRTAQFSRQPRLALAEANRQHVLTGRTVTVSIGEDRVTGVCIGIDEDGQLTLQTDAGIRRCASGVVSSW